MSKEIIIKPSIINSNVIVHFSEPFTLDKHILITVPADFEAHLCINEEWQARIQECNNKHLIDLIGKDFKKENARIAFIRKIEMPLIPWGFGNVRVKNNKLEQTYNVGCNGQYQLTIDRTSKLIKYFGVSNNITLDMLKEKTKPFLEPIARPVLSKYFADTKISVFEIESYLAEIRDKIIAALTREEIFKDLGLKLKTVTVNCIHIPDEDMEAIKASNHSKFNDEITDEIKNINFKINQIMDNQNSDTILDEIDNVKTELLEKIKESETKNADIYSSFLKEINFVKSVLKNANEENTQNKLPLYDKAKERNVSNIKITTDTLLDQAQTDDDFAGVAGVIFSNVEYNLINKYGITHKNKNFVMTEDELGKMRESFVVNGEPLFNDKWRPRLVQTDNPNEKYYEMPLEYRFYKAGLSYEEARLASRCWIIINKLRHRSTENVQSINDILRNMNKDKKSLMKEILTLYRKHNLFDKD